MIPSVIHLPLTSNGRSETRRNEGMINQSVNNHICLFYDALLSVHLCEWATDLGAARDYETRHAPTIQTTVGMSLVMRFDRLHATQRSKSIELEERPKV